MATLIIVIAQAIGVCGTLIHGIIRIERRFAKIEAAIMIIMRECPKCPQISDRNFK